MTLELQNKVINILDILSAKLGVASGHLWEIMIKQSYISAISDIIFAILTIISVVLFVKFMNYCCEEIDTDGQGEESRRINNEWMINVFMLWGILNLFIMIGAIIKIFDIATKLINPEYWALQEILSKLSNL